MSRPIVVYTDPLWAIAPDGGASGSLAGVEREVFGDAVELRFGPAGGGRYLLTGAEMLAAVGGADALVINRCRVTPEILAAAGAGLKAVCRQGVGYDNLEPELLAARGILGFHVPDYCVDEVATHTLALLLALERRVVAQHSTLSAGRFDIYAGGVPRRLSERTAGIVGFGRIGRVVAARLRLFYRRVVAADPYVASDLMAAHGVEKVGFETLLEASDVVLLHCLLNRETEGLVDAAALARMRAGAYLVNTARGALVDARALYEALAGGRLAGAALDVFAPEDPHRDEWWSKVVGLPAVVVTSHRAHLSRESEASLRRRAAEAVLELLRTGRPPAVGLLTPGVGASWAPPLAAGGGASGR